MPESVIPEGMVRFTQALIEDALLRGWFLELDQLPASSRQVAFSQMAQRIRSAEADLDLAAAVSSLARPEIFDAVVNAVRERCNLQ